MAKTSRAKSVEFRLYAPQAKKVSLVGSFNNWSTRKNLAKKDTKGNWMSKVSLTPGRYEYKFFVDNSWWNDPTNSNTSYNNLGSHNNIIEVK
ncbi:MAG: glycogen-binding domain-containing protein [Candidatus Omnitrophica bacterium]|nr:glycogen-binding domain-containing protein [Candidatus Omnitrophota bacterium]